MVKEDSFGLFGGVGGRRGGCWRKEERGGGPGEGAGEREVEAGRRGKACSLSERNNVERAKEGDSHREGVRVFGQQPPGVGSLASPRDMRGLGFLWLGGGGGGYGSLDFGGYVLCGVLVIEDGGGLGFGRQRYYYYICTTILNNLINGRK